VSFTPIQIDNAFAELGLIPPSPAELTALEAISVDYNQGVQTIVTLPEVQTQVVPIVQMFEVGLGHAPSQATLASMVASQLTESQLASAFVSSQAFANVNNDGVLLNPNSLVTPGIVDALFIQGLGHPPTEATLDSFNGLTVAQAFLAFVTSQTTTTALASEVGSYALQSVELAVGVLSQPDTMQIVGQGSLVTHGAHLI
jgi:hypothetical protein